MAETRIEIAVLTHFLSPYQVELFNAVAARDDVSLRVYYLHRSHHERLWGGLDLHHDAVFLEDGADKMQAATQDFQKTPLTVVNYYNEAAAQTLIRIRKASRLPWVFWGERPRQHRYQRASRLYRIWRLRALHQSRAPIWGIGKLAVDAYREEFGESRTYVNIPYFSNLDRFRDASRTPTGDASREWTILCSGSLIPRKGVDLLARAFARLVQDGIGARLKIMGSGPLEGSMKDTLASCIDRVEFLGFRDWNDLPSAYADADLLCVPSRYDGWGLVVPEGLAAGLPVISTHQTGAAVEFVNPGCNGWLIPTDHEEALYRALRQAATLNSAQWMDMSRLARESVAQHSLENGAARFIEAAHGALASWHRSGGMASSATA